MPQVRFIFEELLGEDKLFLYEETQDKAVLKREALGKTLRDITIEAEEGTKLIDCIRKAGFNVETPCSCTGICGKCKVNAKGELSPKTQEEEQHAPDPDTRLACLTKIVGNVEVRFLKACSNIGHSSTDEKALSKKTPLKTINRGFSIEAEVDSSVKMINTFEGESKSSCSYAVAFKGRILDIRKSKGNILGVAVDIGTTGLSAYLVDLESGRVLNRVSGLNPQTEYGGDVLSRITYAMREEKGLDNLSFCIREELNCIVKELVEENFDMRHIYNVAISANTTMLHLFLAVNPESIAKAPYRAVFLDKKELKASEFGIQINKEGILTVLPSASAYVGADILSGTVAVGFQNKRQCSIFIDIGTNGEIVAIKDGNMAATSTAAGPALEGMNISCGMRAEEGAIDSFTIDEEYSMDFTTIGGGRAQGICGSGLIELAAALVQKNIVQKSGRFNKELPEKLSHRLIDKKFYITDEIYISQNDIRQIQLAKAAIASGITMLLKEVGMEIHSLDEAVIAGAFGYHLNPESIKAIGLLPKGFKGKISFVGNSSVEGARLALINEGKLQEMCEIKEKIKVIELSTKADFQNYFVKELSF